MMLLIDTRTPPPDPTEERAAWEPNWRLWGWVALTIAAFVAAGVTSGIVAYVCVCAAIGFVCRAVCVITPTLDGLREYRQ